MRRWVCGAAVMATVTTTAVTACGGDPTVPDDGALFLLEVSGEQFHALVYDPDVVAALDARRASGGAGVVSGMLLQGHGGFNEPWDWHWSPASVHVPDVAIELCDGRPSMVQDDLTYWLETVGQFCPWGATVKERER